MKVVFLLIAVTALLFYKPILVSAKVFTECGLVKQLRSLHVPENEIADWVCVAKHGSNLSTEVIGQPNKAGNQQWGLFQIDDKWGCKGGETKMKKCRVSCKNLITEDITSAVQCAREIKMQKGWNVWDIWRKKCQKNKLDINVC